MFKRQYPNTYSINENNPNYEYELGYKAFHEDHYNRHNKVLLEILACLTSLEKEFTLAREAIFESVNLGNQPYEVNYKRRKHLFAFNVSSSTPITLIASDGYAVVLPSQTWTNIGFPESTRLIASSGQMIVKATDEVIP